MPNAASKHAQHRLAWLNIDQVERFTTLGAKNAKSF